MAITASLTAYMQQTEEQYPWSQWWMSLDPMHWSHAIFRGSLWSEGRTRWPWNGPVALRILSNSMLVTTFGYLAYL